MGKSSSNVAGGLARFVKCAMVAVLIPLAIGLLQGILVELEPVSVLGASARRWATWGLMAYVWLHLLLYRPEPLFRAGHRLFSVLAVWLFGGQVASVEESSGGGGKSRMGKGSRAPKGEGLAQGSTLVAFSPYVIPLYMILVSASGWVARRWLERAWVDAPVSFLIGVTMAFHWLMSADDLQKQRDRWHVETYLLAISLVFILTLLIGSAALPWAIPEFSFTRALADGLSRAQVIYATLIHRLFF